VVQSTFGGYGLINQENVFKVCDQPHPLLVKTIVANCLSLKIDDAYNGMRVRPPVLVEAFAANFAERGLTSQTQDRIPYSCRFACGLAKSLLM